MIELPWPPKELSPNAREHFRVKAAAAKEYRNQAYWLAVGKLTAPGDPIWVSMTFYPPDKRRRDLDNMFASTKAALDGIADALGVDDQTFGFLLERAGPSKGGKIVVRIQ